MSLLKRQDDRVLGAIVLAVILSHIFFMLWLAMQASYTTPQMPARRVIVKTINLQPKQSQAQQKPTAPAPTQSAAKKEAPKVVKKEVAKPKKEEKPVPSKESISKIQENLSKINTKKLQDIPVVDIPANLMALEVENLADLDDASASSAETHYRDELARRLRIYLTLPERGEVVVKLTVGRSGNVLKLTIVSAANQANRKYVEKMVPGLAFSPFGTYFGGETQHTFTIALRSE